MNLHTKRPTVIRLPPKSDFDQFLARASQIAVLLMALLAVLVAMHFGKFILAPIAFAIVVGLMLGPLASRLERTGMSYGLSAALVVLCFLIIVGAFGLAAVVPLSAWMDQTPRLWNELRLQLISLREPFEALSGIRDQLRSLTGSSAAITVESGTPMESMAMLAPSVLAQCLLFLASLYFFMATRHETRVGILRLCFSRRLRWRVAHIFRDVEYLVSRYLVSITLINIGLGLAVGAALWLIGIPSPFLWGMLAGLLNFVIYIGPALMALILFGVGLITFDTIGGSLLPPLVYLALNAIESQFVTPTVIGRTMTLNPFLVFLAVAFWLWMWGPVGGFVAIPMLLICFAVARNMLPGMEWFPSRRVIP